MDTLRIELPGGQWWEIRTVVTRRMRKAFRAAGLKGFLGGLTSNGTVVDMGDPEALKRLAMSHAGEWNLDAIDDAFLLEGTVAWSWPGIVTLDGIDSLDEQYTKPVLTRMQALYAETEGAALKN